MFTFKNIQSNWHLDTLLNTASVSLCPVQPIISGYESDTSPGRLMS
jgi:hypothetical protein